MSRMSRKSERSGSPGGVWIEHNVLDVQMSMVVSGSKVKLFQEAMFFITIYSYLK